MTICEGAGHAQPQINISNHKIESHVFVLESVDILCIFGIIINIIDCFCADCNNDL